MNVCGELGPGPACHSVISWLTSRQLSTSMERKSFELTLAFFFFTAPSSSFFGRNKVSMLVSEVLLLVSEICVGWWKNDGGI